jgi:hypothetical protein
LYFMFTLLMDCRGMDLESPGVASAAGFRVSVTVPVVHDATAPLRSKEGHIRLDTARLLSDRGPIHAPPEAAAMRRSNSSTSLRR